MVGEGRDHSLELQQGRHWAFTCSCPGLDGYAKRSHNLHLHLTSCIWDLVQNLSKSVLYI